VIVSSKGFTNFVLRGGCVEEGFFQYLLWGESRGEVEGVETCPEKGCSSGQGGEFDISSLKGMMVGVSNGNGGSKVVYADTNWGGLICLYEVPICLSGSYSDSLEEGRAYGGEVEDLPGVEMESRWESRNMAAELWGSESSGMEGAKIVMPVIWVS
jgi:hypothetical protein